MPELRRYFDMIPAERIVLDPAPGTATKKHLIRENERKYRLCELVDGVLLEKPMGTKEGLLGGWLLHFLWQFLEAHRLGIVLGGDAALELMPDLVRVPDVSFISFDRLPGRKVPAKAIAPLSPGLAVEVLSPSNTKKEMQRKCREYLTTGSRLVWLIYPKTRVVEVHKTAGRCRRLRIGQVLDGGDVLPGFELPLSQLLSPPGLA
jgi:Uma2 family endonuclease